MAIKRVEVPTMSYSGVTITVDTFTGRFEAAVDDISISEDTLAAARAKIDRALTARKSASKVKLALPVIVISGQSDEFQLANVTGIHRTTREIQLDSESGKGKGNKPPRWSRRDRIIIADTPANRERATAYIEQRERWNQTRESVEVREIEIDGHGRIDIDAYDAVVAKLTAQHKKSAAATRD